MRGPNATIALSAADVVDHMLARCAQVSHGGAASSFATPGQSICYRGKPVSRGLPVHECNEVSGQCVYGTSHQTHYVDLNTNFAETWFCASEAEHKKYEKIFLFRETKNGSSKFGDRFVKWCVRMIRDLTSIILEGHISKNDCGDNGGKLVRKDLIRKTACVISQCVLYFSNRQ
jgi:hypothetical protein